MTSATSHVKLCICSSVNTDYFRFFKRCLESQGLAPVAIYALEEMEYRAAARARGWSRFKLRWNMYIAYPVSLCRRALTAGRGTVFIVTSNTFFAPLLVALIGKVRRLTTIHLLYDLFPDALEVSGALRPHGVAARMVGRITRLTQRICHGSVYLGELLRTHTRQRWGASRNDRSIDIGADDALFEAHHPNPREGVLTCHYGGQLGYMHDAEGLTASIAAVLREGTSKLSCRFHFNVSGAQAQFIHQAFKDPRVMVEDAIPAAEWRRKIREFQVGLVTLSPGGASVCLPSKTYSMMAGGLAILAICPIWSDLARLILENQAGWVVNNSPYSSWDEISGPGYWTRLQERRDLAAIAGEFQQHLQKIAENPGELAEKRLNAWRCVRDKYGLQPIGHRWKEYLENRLAYAPDSVSADFQTANS